LHAQADAEVEIGTHFVRYVSTRSLGSHDQVDAQ
jgi:hypothetical protein